MVMRVLNILLFVFLGLFQVKAQSTYRLVQQGNKELGKENYAEGEVLYRKALDLDAALTIGQFNIGNAKYLQEDYESAIAKYEKSAGEFSLKKDKAEAFHNLGNAFLSQEKYEESIEAYKSALKLEPNDMDTKYNLAYAQLKLKKEQEQEQQEQNEEEQEEDQEEQEEEENEEEGEEDPKEEDGQEEESDEGEEEESDEGKEEESEEGEDEESDQGEEEESDEGAEEDTKDSGEDEGEEERPANANDAELTQEEAEQILNMLQSEEGKLQEKLDEEEKGDPIKVIFQKDW